MIRTKKAQAAADEDRKKWNKEEAQRRCLRKQVAKIQKEKAALEGKTKNKETV